MKLVLQFQSVLCFNDARDTVSIYESRPALKVGQLVLVEGTYIAIVGNEIIKEFATEREMLWWSHQTRA